MATLSEARYLACHKFPYLSHGIISLIPEPKEGLGTLATTENSVMYYDPIVETKWSLDELAGGLVHETMHLILNHYSLQKEFNAGHYVWNLAGDMVINQQVCQVFKLPDPVLPQTFKLPSGLTVHEYYTLLMKNAQKININVCCGSASGNPHPQEGKEDCSGRSKAEIESIKRQIALDIKEHIKNKGSIPADLARWADSVLLPPKIPWQQKLRTLARQSVTYAAGKVDYKWGSISRRQWGIGIGKNKPLLPTLKAPIPKVAVAIDTSGSMSSVELKLAVAECQGILANAGAKVDFIACDMIVHKHVKVSNINEIKKGLKGGGGTSFIPVFEELNKEKPDILIFITDGYGTAPSVSPSYKVIWLLVGKNTSKPCSYGEFIKVEE